LQTITNEPIGLIILITSWLTINIATFPLGQMNIIRVAINIGVYTVQDVIVFDSRICTKRGGFRKDKHGVPDPVPMRRAKKEK
jgi:hypothetical protein